MGWRTDFGLIWRLGNHLAKDLFLKGSPAAESLWGMVKMQSSGPRHRDSESGEMGLWESTFLTNSPSPVPPTLVLVTLLHSRAGEGPGWLPIPSSPFQLHLSPPRDQGLWAWHGDKRVTFDNVQIVRVLYSNCCPQQLDPTGVLGSSGCVPVRVLQRRKSNRMYIQTDGWIDR